MAEPLSRSLRRLLAPVETCDAGFATSLRLDPGFAGFAGHFPGHPVLPGVCLIQAFVQAAGLRREGAARLRRVRSVRFQAPVRPGEVLALDWTERDAPGGGVRVSGTATVSDRKAALVDLVVEVA